MADTNTPTTPPIPRKVGRPRKTTGEPGAMSGTESGKVPMTGATAPTSPLMTSPSPTLASSPTASSTHASERTDPSTRDHLTNAKDSAVSRVKEEAAKGKEQALATATTYADQGKDKAAGALTTLSGFIVEAAKMLEENFGHKAADPVRASADRVSGVARHLETADVDQLTSELKAFAKNNPVLSVGTVAVVGFALGKLLSGGSRD